MVGSTSAVKARVRVSLSASPATIKALSETIRIAAGQLGAQASDPIEITMCRSFGDEELSELIEETGTEK